MSTADHMNDLDQLISNAVGSAFEDARRSLATEIRQRSRQLLRSARSESFQALHRAVGSIDAGDTQAAVLEALLEESGRFASRTALLLTFEDRTTGWACFGFGEESQAIDTVEVELGSGPWAEFATGTGWVSLAGSDCGRLCDPLEADRPEEGVLVPLILRGRVAAALYADRLADEEDLQLDPIRLLVYAAAYRLELLAFGQQGTTATLHPAGPERAALSFWDPDAVAREAEAPTPVAAPLPEEPAEEEEQLAEVSVEEPKVEAAEPITDVTDDEPAAEGVVEEMAAEEDLVVAETPWAVEDTAAVEPMVAEVEAIEEEGIADEVELAEAAEEGIEAEAVVVEAEEELVEAEAVAEKPWEATVEPLEEEPLEAPEPAAEEETGTPEELGEADVGSATVRISREMMERYSSEALEAVEDEPDVAPLEAVESIETFEPIEAVEEVEVVEEAPEAETLDDMDTVGAVEAVAVEAVTEVESVEEVEEPPAEAPATVEAEEPPPAETSKVETVEEATGPTAKLTMGSTEVAPPPDLDGPGWAFRDEPQGQAVPSAEVSPLHEEARRLARLLVSEIKLYNEEQVQEGRRHGDVYARLQEDIDRSRQMYAERVDPSVLGEVDYFQQELVNILAGGDADALGV